MSPQDIALTFCLLQATLCGWSDTSEKITGCTVWQNTTTCLYSPSLSKQHSKLFAFLIIADQIQKTCPIQVFYHIMYVWFHLEKAGQLWSKWKDWSNFSWKSKSYQWDFKSLSWLIHVYFVNERLVSKPYTRRILCVSCKEALWCNGHDICSTSQ